MPKKNIPFEEILLTLKNPSVGLPTRHLERFSDIHPADLKALMAVWPQIVPARKQAFLQALADEYDENTQYSFRELAHAIIHDPEPGVRVLAVRLLEEIEDVNNLPLLIGLLRNDPQPVVRAAVATILKPFVEMAEIEELSPGVCDELLNNLIQAAQSGDAVVRRAALQSLGYSSRPEVSALIDDALQHHDPLWIASALTAIGRSASARWNEDVLAHMRSEDREIRLAAVEAAGELGLKTAPSLLFELIEDEEDDEVFEAIIWSLSQIGGEDVRPFLETLLDQAEEESAIEFIEEALMNLDFTEDMEGFDLIAFDPDDEPDVDEYR